MATSNREIEMGPVGVFFKAGSEELEVDLGYTSGGTKITVSQETQEVEVDQELDPIEEVITKRTVQVEVPLAAVNVDTLKLAFPGSSIVTDKTTPTKKKLVLGATAGKSLKSFAGELRLHPVEKDADDKSEDYLFPCAAPIGNIDMTFAKNELRVVNVTFKAFPGENKETMIYGDPAASAS